MNPGSIEGRSRSLEWIADRNPFYLLSACCGLLGCWLLGDVSQPDALTAASRISGVLAYQLVVVALGVWLARQNGMRRDAAILSVLTLILGADISFFYLQAAMLPIRGAAYFSFFGAAQSMVVIGILLRGLGVRLSKGVQWLVALDLMAIYLSPPALRWCFEHDISMPVAFFSAFTAIALTLILHALPDSWHAEAMVDVEEDLPRTLAWLTPTVALASLTAHVIAVEWIYDVRFLPVYCSPLFLALACLFLRWETKWIPFDNAEPNPMTPGSLAFGLAVLAVMFAFTNAPPGTVWDGGGWSWLGLSPLRLVLLSSSAVFWGAGRLRPRPSAFFAALTTALVALLGHTTGAILRHLSDIGRAVLRLLSLVPESRQEWGVLLSVLAFVLIGAGAWISWRRVQS